MNKPCVAQFEVTSARGKLPLSWTGVIPRSQANRITEYCDDGSLDFHGFTPYIGLNAQEPLPMSAAIRKHFSIISEDAGMVKAAQHLLRQARKQFFGTVDFPAAFEAVLAQKHEEEQEQRDTEAFENNVAEAEARGEVFDDGVEGSEVLSDTEERRGAKHARDSDDDDSHEHKLAAISSSSSLPRAHVRHSGGRITFERIVDVSDDEEEEQQVKSPTIETIEE